MILKKKQLYKLLKNESVNKSRYKKILNFSPKNKIEEAYKYFYINRTSFSGIMNKPRWGYKIGSSVEIMSPEHHDRVLAITSHLPHLIAYNIVNTAADLETVTKSDVIKYSASGFRDFTRIASSDPTMWRDIFINNK